MGFADEVSRLEDVKDGDVIKAEHKNELNRALRELAKVIDTEQNTLKIKGSLELGDIDWARIKIDYPKWDRWNIFTEEGADLLSPLWRGGSP